MVGLNCKISHRLLMIVFDPFCSKQSDSLNSDSMEHKEIEGIDFYQVSTRQ